jgi:glycosyltransferase involved in cell wall biosynthesis
VDGKLRIVHLVDSLDCGGAEQVVASLATRQSEHGHSVRVVCLRGLGPYPVDLGALRLAGVAIMALEKPEGFDWRTLRRMIRYLAAEPADVLHAHNHVVHHYGAVAGRVARVGAVISTVHGSSSLRMSRTAHALFWFACSISDKVVSVCAPVDAVFRKSFPLRDAKYHVVDNGIDLSRFLAIADRRSCENVVFGTIGRFDAVKDHENLLRAFALVRRRNPQVRLRLLGEGSLGENLRMLARSLSIESDVYFEGFSLDTPKFLSALDVYVIPSRSEGLPLTLLEAMGAGLPIVATAVGAIPDIVNHGQSGWLCPPADPERLAEAMELATQAPDRPSIGARSRQTVAIHYSVERMARDYENLYATLLHRDPTPLAPNA